MYNLASQWQFGKPANLLRILKVNQPKHHSCLSFVPFVREGQKTYKQSTKLHALPTHNVIEIIFEVRKIRIEIDQQQMKLNHFVT